MKGSACLLGSAGRQERCRGVLLMSSHICSSFQQCPCTASTSKQRACCPQNSCFGGHGSPETGLAFSLFLSSAGLVLCTASEQHLCPPAPLPQAPAPELCSLRVGSGWHSTGLVVEPGRPVALQGPPSLALDVQLTLLRCRKTASFGCHW